MNKITSDFKTYEEYVDYCNYEGEKGRINKLEHSGLIVLLYELTSKKNKKHEQRFRHLTKEEFNKIFNII